MLLPVDFPYWAFTLIIRGNGLGSGLFASPNTSAIMSSVPARDRGSASGMGATFQNSGMSLSIGIFFSLMIAGLAATLPATLVTGLRAQGVPASVAGHVARLPPVSTLFASFSATTRSATCSNRRACSASYPRATSPPSPGSSSSRT
jgi:hypothetical protein